MRLSCQHWQWRLLPWLWHLSWNTGCAVQRHPKASTQKDFGGNGVYFLKREERQEPGRILKAGKPECRKDEGGKKSLFLRILHLVATGFPHIPFPLHTGSKCSGLIPVSEHVHTRYSRPLFPSICSLVGKILVMNFSKGVSRPEMLYLIFNKYIIT